MFLFSGEKKEKKRGDFDVAVLCFGYLGIMRHPSKSTGGAPAYDNFSVCP
jgi:hypothetical protein